jgi:hypothetical protein
MLLVSHIEALNEIKTENCLLKYYIWDKRSFKKLIVKNLGPITDKNGRQLINCNIGE